MGFWNNLSKQLNRDVKRFASIDEPGDVYTRKNVAPTVGVLTADPLMVMSAARFSGDVKAVDRVLGLGHPSAQPTNPLLQDNNNSVNKDKLLDPVNRTGGRRNQTISGGQLKQSTAGQELGTDVGFSATANRTAPHQTENETDEKLSRQYGRGVRR